MSVERKFSHRIVPGDFRFMPRVALFHPTDDGGNDGDPAGDTDLENDDAGNAGDDGEAGKGEQKKLVSLDRHKAVLGKKEARITKLETDLKAMQDADADRKKSEMSEVDRLKAENAELQKKNQAFEASEKKQDALIKAKQALEKDGKVIDPDKEARLANSLRKLAFDDDTLDDDVAELVQMAAMPKGPGHRTVAGKTSKPDDSDKDPLSYSGKELGEISKESPERFQAIMAARKKAIAAKERGAK